MNRTKVILVLLMGCMILSELACGQSGEELYNADRTKILSAVREAGSRVYDFISMQDETESGLVGGVDVVGPNVIDGERYYTMAVCPLLTSAFPPGILQEVPASCEAKGCADSPNASGRNVIPNTAHNLSVTCTGHYRWLTTLKADIASMCIGDECRANDEDGYQGVYP